MNLTQAGLAKRSGVSLATLRRFEQKALISLESFLAIHGVLGTLNALLKATEPTHDAFSSIEDVLKANQVKRLRQRGRRS